MSKVITKRVNPDSRGRISLKGLVEADGYEATLQPDGTIILKPFLQVDSREAWIYKNKQALASLEQGLKDMAEGKLVDKGNFADFVDIDIS